MTARALGISKPDIEHAYQATKSERLKDVSDNWTTRSVINT